MMLSRFMSRINRLFVRDADFNSYHNVFDQHQEIIEFFSSFGEEGEKRKILDVGGGDGTFLRSLLGSLQDRFEITVLDIEDHPDGLARVIADICDPTLTSDGFGQFDTVFSYNAMEHFADPITAAANMCRFMNSKGALICATVFSWRYHPVPDDYFRFTDSALRYLFSQRGGLEEIKCGYDLTRRREDIRGGYFGNKDIPPIDLYGGFRENWSILYIGSNAINKATTAEQITND
jgi:SAM-dependent methyltransferase